MRPPQTSPAVVDPPTSALAFEVHGRREFALVRVPVAARRSDEALVRTLWTGISRGSERLVADGAVPTSERERMRAPFQVGDFPWPVRYGYMAVGVVEQGPPELQRAEVYCLHPHQDRFVVPAAALTPLPPGLPARRAVLGANMETALNATWDADVHVGDHVTVVGAGVVGAAIAYLAQRIAGTQVTLVDVNAARADLARSLGVAFETPDGALPSDQDVVFHTSATEAGLALALGVAGKEARVVELSWYGDRAPRVPLGAAFHARRLQLVCSQVGEVAPARRARWSRTRRLALALELLCDPILDVLLSGETSLEDLPHSFGDILDDPTTLCHLVRHSAPCTPSPSATAS